MFQSPLPFPGAPRSALGCSQHPDSEPSFPEHSRNEDLPRPPATGDEVDAALSLRLFRGPHRASGEHPELFPLPPPQTAACAGAPPLDGHRRPPEPGRGGRGQALTSRLTGQLGQPTRTGVHPSALEGQTTLGVKSSSTFYFNSRKVQNLIQTCKMHTKLSVYQKILYNI
jgi:hypothetical protein